MSRCIASSLDARRSFKALPSMSVTASISSVMRPLLTCVGVATMRPSSRRTLTLPSEETTYERSYMSLPTRTISRRAVCSSIRLCLSSAGSVVELNLDIPRDRDRHAVNRLRLESNLPGGARQALPHDPVSLSAEWRVTLIARFDPLHLAVGAERHAH